MTYNRIAALGAELPVRPDLIFTDLAFDNTHDLLHVTPPRMLCPLFIDYALLRALVKYPSIVKSDIILIDIILREEL